MPAPRSGGGRPIDRAALERVLGRAAELQVGGTDSPETITEAQLFEIGKEVGLSPETLRQALAEERTRVVLAPEPGLAARIAGPGLATASRVVGGTVAATLAALDDWMVREECLQAKRRYGERLTWEPRRDFVSTVRRELNLGGRGYALSRASEIAATVTEVEDARVLVRLDADVSGSRRQRLAAGGVTAAGGVATGGALATAAVVAHAAAVAVFPLALLPVVAGAGIGYAIARGQRGLAARMQVALEQVLDRLEHGELRRGPTLLDVLSRK